MVVADLTRRYGDLLALDHVGFTVETGQIVALLGPNGAGKTTAVEILEGYRPRDDGQVSVLGFDPADGGRAYRERIGIVLQTAGFEDEFTVDELLRLQASLYPRRYDPGELAGLVGLADRRRTRVKALSGGQRRRLDLALGLAGRPDLLFLDEPTTGFDPAARRHAWDLIDRLREQGTTILLTTHYIEEAERLADRVAVLRAGRLVAWGRPSELEARCGLPTRLAFRLPDGFTADRLPPMSGVRTVEGADVVVRTHRAVADTRLLTDWAAANHLDLPTLTLTPPGLEDAYLSLTGEPADDHR
ncbi:ABC transporter ATP-binding protein [Actinoplanes nipponensis]|uniref:ABC transporter ATP-binding protein n=1 Tax=Actinoplanes nipponensis TaxID=135950 RepID=UPI0031E94608